jgi:hypothetical protein
MNRYLISKTLVSLSFLHVLTFVADKETQLNIEFLQKKFARP